MRLKCTPITICITAPAWQTANSPHITTKLLFNQQHERPLIHRLSWVRACTKYSSWGFLLAWTLTKIRLIFSLVEFCLLGAVAPCTSEKLKMYQKAEFVGVLPQTPQLELTNSVLPDHLAGFKETSLRQRMRREKYGQIREILEGLDLHNVWDKSTPMKIKNTYQHFIWIIRLVYNAVHTTNYFLGKTEPSIKRLKHTRIGFWTIGGNLAFRSKQVG